MYGKTHNEITYDGIIFLEAPTLDGDKNLLKDNLSNGKLKLSSSDTILCEASKTGNEIKIEYKLNNSKDYIRYTDISTNNDEKVLAIDEKSYYLLGETLYDNLQKCIDNQENFITQSTLEGYNYVTEENLKGKKYLTSDDADTLISDSIQTATNSLTARLTNMEGSYVSLSNTITSLEDRIKALEGKLK